MVSLRRRTRIEVYNPEDRGILKELHNFFLTKGMNSKYEGGMLEVKLYSDEPEFAILMHEIGKRELKYRYFEVREYTKKEIEEFKLFHMGLAFPYELDGEIPNYGTMYENSCPACDTVRLQTSDLIVNMKKFVKYDISTLMPEILINERLRLLLEENQITGYVLRPVTDFKGRTDLLLYQLIITNVLPDMSTDIKVEVEHFRGNKNFKPYPCEICGRNGIIRRSEAIYEHEELAEVYDFNLSMEYFGVNMYCVQDIIVTQKLRRLFKNNKISRVVFEPVYIK